MRYMADCFIASLHCNSERIYSVASFLGTTKPFSDERRLYLLVYVKSLDAALHSIPMTSSNESSNESSKFCTSAAAVYYYGIRTHSVCLMNISPANISTPLYPASLECQPVFPLLCNCGEIGSSDFCQVFVAMPKSWQSQSDCAAVN